MAVRTLVISDLHLGSVLGRDVLRRPRALAALTEQVAEVDRLVLLGDTVELLEGRPRRAMAGARDPLRALGGALPPGGEVLVILGNHDHALVRPHLRERRAAGRALGLATRIPAKATPGLEALTGALKPARVRVQYPGAWLERGVYATHGHYVDRHLLPRRGVLARGPFAALPERGAKPDDYERSGGPSLDAASSALAVELPDVVAGALDAATGAARRVTLATAPAAARLMRTDALAPFTAGALGYQFRRAGLPAMAAAARALGVRATHLLFGHLHRTGPLAGDDLDEWRPDPRGPRLHNAGSWVYEPLLLSGARPPHPYWPGGAILLEAGEAPRTVALLDGVGARDL